MEEEVREELLPEVDQEEPKGEDTLLDLQKASAQGRYYKWFIFGVIQLAVFVDAISYSVVIPILPLYIESLNVSEGWIGLLFGIFSASYLIAAAIAVSMVNRFGKKFSMICSILLLEGSTLLFAFGTSYWVLFVARFLQGASSGVMWTASMSLVADYYPTNEQGTIYGMVNVSMGIGVFAGPILGGALMDWAGHRKEVPFLVICAIAGIDGVARLFIREPKILGPEEEAGWLSLSRDIRLMLVCVSVFVAQGVLTAVEPTLPVFYRYIGRIPSESYFSDMMGLSAFWIGVMVGVPLIAFTVCSPLVGKFIDKFPQHRHACISLGLFLIAAVFPFLSYFQGIPQMRSIPSLSEIAIQVILLICLGIGDALTATPSVTILFWNGISEIQMPIINSIIEEKYQSKYFAAGAAMDNSFYSAGSFLGPVFAAALVQFIGFVPAFATTGAFVGILALVYSIGVFMSRDRKEKHFPINADI